MNLYLFSGLGADKRAFRFLKYPKGLNIIHIDWIEPLKNESIQSYAKRISSIIDTTKPYSIIGLSFGGMMAIEVAQFLNPQKLILISSVENKKEMPFYFKLTGFLKLNKLMPRNLKIKSNFLINWFFGVKNTQEKKMLSDIIEASNPRFTYWAINEILNWKKEITTLKVIRIHGDMDKIFPIKNFKPQYLIANGGHLMVANKADEISGVLETILETTRAS